MAKATKSKKSWLRCRHWWRIAPSNRRENSGPNSNQPDHPVTIRDTASFYHNSLEKKSMDLPIFNYNSHLIGRLLEVFVAQDILCVTKVLPPSLHQENKVTPSSPPFVQGPSLHAHLWLFLSEEALVLPSTSCTLQKSDVTKSDWITATLCHESLWSLPEQGKARPKSPHGSDHRVDHCVTGHF